MPSRRPDLAHAVLAALVLFGCGPAPSGTAPAEAERVDPFALQIEIGRYSVMLGQARDLTEDRPGAQETASDSPPALARSLRHVVWQYNLDRSRLCGRGLFTDIACGSAYEPVWISEPDTAQPTLEELQSRSSAVGEEVMRFWDAVCEDARTRTADEEERRIICAIE